MQQPVQQTVLQAAKHIVTDTRMQTQNTHTYTHKLHINKHTEYVPTHTEGPVLHTLKQHSDAHNQINQKNKALWI